MSRLETTREKKGYARLAIQELLESIAKEDGLMCEASFGSVKVTYELKFEKGKFVTFIVEDPVRHTFKLNQ